MRQLGIVCGALFWKDDDGTVYPALSKCCQGMLVDVGFVTARCSECVRPVLAENIRREQTQLFR